MREEKEKKCVDCSRTLTPMLRHPEESYSHHCYYCTFIRTERAKRSRSERERSAGVRVSAAPCTSPFHLYRFVNEILIKNPYYALQALSTKVPPEKETDILSNGQNQKQPLSSKNEQQVTKSSNASP